MPTGSGKTWVYAIIAKYYSSIGKSTAVIVPNEALRGQTIGAIGTSDPNISVYTIRQFYEHPTKDEVLVIDEYDEILENSAFISNGVSINGLWQLQNR